MPKIYTDGIVREMAAEELAALEAARQEQPAPDPTPEDRLAALESAVLALLGDGLVV